MTKEINIELHKVYSLDEIEKLRCRFHHTQMIYAGPHTRQCQHHGICDFKVYYLNNYESSGGYKLTAFGGTPKKEKMSEVITKQSIVDIVNEVNKENAKMNTKYIDFFRTLNMRTNETKYKSLLDDLGVKCDEAVEAGKSSAQFKINQSNWRLYIKPIHDSDCFSINDIFCELRKFCKFAKECYNLNITSNQITYDTTSNDNDVNSYTINMAHENCCILDINWENQTLEKKPPQYRIISE